MYYKVLIVDDEETIREGLKMIVDWNGLGFEITGEAANGIEALDFISSKGCPDVVLADIRMPAMDGLELIKAVNESGYNVHFIILSGYDYFEYAKRAIELGAFDYILKPTKLDELNSKFLRLKEKLDEDQKKNVIISKGMESIREDYVKNLLYNRYSQKEEPMREIDHIGLLSRGEIFKVLVLHLIFKGYSGDSSVVERNVWGFACQLPDCVPVADDSGNLVFIFIGCKKDDSEAVERYVELSAGNLIDYVRRLNCHTRIGTGNIVEDFMEIHTSYTQAVSALEKSFFTGRDNIVKFSQCEDTKQIKMEYPAEYEVQLIHAIERADKTAASDIIDCMFNDILILQSVQPAYLFRICVEMIIAISRNYKNISGSIESAFDESRVIYNKFSGFETVGELKDWLKERICFVIDMIMDIKENTNNRIVNHIRKIISREYQKQINLVTIANELYMNPDYLSRLFKKETGQSFIDYLTSYRVEKAKLLLKDVTVKSYEVAFMVGYNESCYFSKVFKSFTGKSVTEYRREVQDG